MIASLGKVADLWLAPPFRHTAVTQLSATTGLSTSQVERAIDNAFIELQSAKLEQFSPPSLSSKKLFRFKVLIIMAGNVFTAWLPSAVTVLLMGGECFLKPATLEPLSASLWKHSITAVDPGLANRVHIVNWSNDLPKAMNLVIVYGSDEAVSSIRQQVPPQIPLIGYGHKMSVALLLKDAIEKDRQAVLSALRNDLYPFDLRGCLSPQLVFAETDAYWFAENIGNPSVQIKAFNNWSSFLEDLRPYIGKLSCLGVAASQASLADIDATVADLAFSRVCRLGDMQRPPLEWRNGNISLKEELQKLDGSLQYTDGKA